MNKEEKERIKFATGYYTNVFNESGLDLFIILSEGNKEPTTDDYIFIENTVIEHIDRYGCIWEEKLAEILEEEFPAGIQLVNHSIGYTKL